MTAADGEVTPAGPGGRPGVPPSAAGEPCPADTRAVVGVLEAGISVNQGRARRIERVDRRVSDYSTSFRIEELDVTLDGGDRYRVVFKDLDWRALLSEASAVRPRFLYDPCREIAVYQSLLAGRNLGTADCYAAVADGGAGRYWLFLEHVPAAQLCHVGEFTAWEHAARWLARLHVTFAADAEADGPLRGGVPLLSYNRAFYLVWPARAEVLLRTTPAVAGEFGGRAARLVRHYDRVVDRLAALDRTVIHGEFYAANVLVTDRARRGTGVSSGPGRICPVDWEMAALGPGLMDVAALTAGRWTSEQRASLLAAYRSELVEAGGSPRPLPELADALEWCRLHLAMQWLGWSAGWSAPAEQAQDWLGQAVTIADRLGL